MPGDDMTSALDRSAARAWREFQAGLADRLAELEGEDVLVVDVLTASEPDDGAAPYVRFCAWAEGMLRGEASGNHVLSPSYELDDAGERALLALGYDAPTHAPDGEAEAGSLNYYTDLGQDEADRLAVMSVRALREVFGVAHPALLAGDAVAAAPSEPAVTERLAGEEDAATFPRGGHEELTGLVDAALTPYLGHPPCHDEDGDIPVDLGDTVLFVRVCENVPVVELFACVATDVQDAPRAAFEVNVLNRDVRYVKFRLVGDSILADLQLPAWPFAPEQLRAMLAMMTGAIEQVAGDLQARVGGRALLAEPEVDLADPPGGDPTESPDDEERGPRADRARDGRAARPADPASLPAELVRRTGLVSQIMAELEAETAGSVTPELAASISGHDPELILELIADQERQAASWRGLRDELAAADPGEDSDDRDHQEWVAMGCDHEIEFSQRMLTLLRLALRVTVERLAAGDKPVASSVASSVALSAAPSPVPASGGGRPSPARLRRRHPPRPRRVPDPTIEEVDPDIWG